MKLLNHTEIYKGFNINLYVDEIETDSGKITKREVVERPNAVVILPVEFNYDSLEWDVYLVCQYRYPAHEYLWELPAGKIEGLDGPEATAHKELAEEINFKAGVLKSVGGWYQSPGYSTEYMHAFLAMELSPVNPSDYLADDTGEIEIIKISIDQAINKCHDAKSLLCLSMFKLGNLNG